MTKKINVRMLTTGAICIALAFVLSYIRIFHLPQGGSITPASMLPLMIFAYIYGFKRGVLAAICYGLLQFIQDPFIVHWIQFLLDYVFAFGCLAVAGLFKSVYAGVSLAVLGRYIFHVLSGVVFFAEYAPAGENVYIYSLIYNSFVLIDGAICVIIMLIPQLRKFVFAQKQKLIVKS